MSYNKHVVKKSRKSWAELQEEQPKQTLHDIRKAAVKKETIVESVLEYEELNFSDASINPLKVRKH